jgi:hypothetical protein
MTSLLQIAVRQMHLGLLRSASLIVPHWKRAEWLQEWRTELWYVLRECASETSLHSRSVGEATAFCMGAYKDAIWLRRRYWQTERPFTRISSSAAACLLLLIAVLFMTWGVTRTSPRVIAGISRIQVYPWRVSGGAMSPCDCPFDFIVKRKSLRDIQLLFDGFSHYKIAQETVWSERVPRTEWTVAQARADFFDLLHLPVRMTEGGARTSQRLPQLVLSRNTWMRDFGGNASIVGAKLHVGSADAVVAGVAFGGSMGLPGGANAWLLGSDPPGKSVASEYVVGHLSPSGYFDDGRWILSVAGILFAFLLFPFVGRPFMGEYGSGSQKPSLISRSRFWAFMLAKTTLLIAIVYYSSLDLGSLLVQPFSPSSEYLQGTSSVLLCLLGLRWVFRDQQGRCPVCLRRMAHPVEVGQPSRTFLEWNGTEMVCERGHALLHVPEIPTSWFGAQRWVCLDGSWQFLFARPSRPLSP